MVITIFTHSVNPSAALSVGITEHLALRVQQLAQRPAGRDGPHVDLEVERDLGPVTLFAISGPVFEVDGPTDGAQAHLRVRLLPFPVDVVDVTVMEVEERVWRNQISQYVVG